MHQGEALRDAGSLQEAMAEFKLAAQIDTSSSKLGVQMRRNWKERCILQS